MAKMTFNIVVECEVQTLEEALAEEEGNEEAIAWLTKPENVKGFPMPHTIYSITCNGQPVTDEGEDYMEHRYLIAGTGGDGYTLSVTHYIV